VTAAFGAEWRGQEDQVDAGGAEDFYIKSTSVRLMATILMVNDV
jgi:hypothetical protein